MTPRTSVCALLTALLGPGVAAGPGALADQAPDLKRLLSEKAPAYVTIKYVLKVEGQYGNRELERDITGVVVDPAGLVLCANSQLSSRVLRGFGGSATPTDIRILVGDDVEGLPAKVLARDTELDLAWLLPKEPLPKSLPFLDLANAAVPSTGDRLVTLRRMAKYFDRAMLITEGRLAGRTTKPRELLVPGGGMNLEPGLPVFSAGGQVVGVVVIQLPEDEEMQGNPMAFAGIGRDVAGGLILPSAEVLRATRRAKEAADSDEDEPSQAPRAAGDGTTGTERRGADKAEPPSTEGRTDDKPGDSDDDDE